MKSKSFNQPRTFSLVRNVAIGDSFAAIDLYERWKERFIAMAKLKCPHADDLTRDEVINAAFHGFIANARSGKTNLQDPEDFERWMWMLIGRRAIDRIRKEARESKQPLPMNMADSRLVVESADQVIESLMQKLPTEMKPVGALALQGFSALEIKNDLRISLSSVYRRLAAIQSVWQQNLK